MKPQESLSEQTNSDAVILQPESPERMEVSGADPVARPVDEGSSADLHQIIEKIHQVDKGKKKNLIRNFMRKYTSKVCPMWKGLS